MIHPTFPNCQRGVALILALLLLFVLTLVAVSSYTSSHVQERAASNARLQTMAFEAAAAGANNAIDFFLTNVEADAPDTLCGRKDHLGWEDPTPWQEVTYDVDGVRLYQRMYCLNDEYPCGPGEVGCVAGARPPRSQLFVASRGEVEANGNVVAFREVEVRIDRKNDEYIVEGCGALCFPACEADSTDGPGNQGPEPAIDFPSSNVFTVDGGGGAAVTTGLECDDSSLLDAILDDLKDSREGNYVGGLLQQDPGEPWNDPDLTDAFRAEIEALAAAGGTNEFGGENLLIGPGLDNSRGTGYFDEGSGTYIDNGNTDYGTPADPMITYVKGDLEMGGGISGAGIIMVEGNIAWSGTPDFQGLIVTLGGTYTIDGGGLGGNHAGSVVVLDNGRIPPLDGECSPGCPEFEPVSWLNTGGGTAEYNWDCDALSMAFAMVPNPDGSTGDSGTGDSGTGDSGTGDSGTGDSGTGDDGMPYPNDWGFDCDRGPPDLFETPGELVIASWRENIGWREEFFAAE